MTSPGNDPHAPFPLSRGQEALYYLHRLAPDASVYHCLATARIKTSVDVPAFERAVGALVQRHSMLRARIVTDGGTVQQRVAEDEPSGFEVIDGRSWDRETLDRTTLDRLHRPFDLANGPIYRIVLIQESDDWQLSIVVHHLFYDGLSSGILLRDLSFLYACERDGGELPPVAGAEYRDFVQWQRQLDSTEQGKAQRAYWTEKLAGAPVGLHLPTDHARGLSRFEGDAVPLQMDVAKCEALHGLAQAEGVTLNMLLLTAFQVLLARYSGQTDILIGAPAFGRTSPEFLDRIGYFVNPIVFRAKLDDNPRFRDLLAATKKDVLESLENQDDPFPALVEALDPPRDASRNPFFQVMIDWQKREWLGSMVDATGDTHEARLRLNMGELVLEDENRPQQEGLFDLTLDVRELGKVLQGELKYDSNLFEHASIERMQANFQTLLDSILADPYERVFALDLVARSEREALRPTKAPAAEPLPWEGAWFRRLLEHGNSTPTKVAACFGDQSLTYAELCEHVDRVARALVARGAGPGSRIAVCLPRSLDLLVALVAVQRAGASYVPLDPTYPPARVALILEDANADLVLTTSELGSRLPAARPSTVHLADLDQASCEEATLPTQDDLDSLAYTIFTSGSTGRPKGVEIPQSALANLLYATSRRPGLSSDDTLVAVTTVSFDIAGLELFLPLLTGATVVIASEREAADGRLLTQLLERHQTTILQATPATWRLLLDTGWSSPNLRGLCGGEALPRDLAERLLPNVRELWNMYGPTETTIWSLTHQVASGTGPVSLGTPLANTQVLLLDEHGGLVPRGVVGRLFLGGAGLARGYTGVRTSRPSASSTIAWQIRLGLGCMTRVTSLASGMMAPSSFSVARISRSR